MRHFTARHLALAALVPALFVLSVIPGCSNEGEGERCGDVDGINNNDDCQSGLTCTAIPVNGTSDSVGRCCYTNRVTDSRCAITTGVSARGANADAGAAGSVAPEPTGTSGGSSTSDAGMDIEIGSAGSAGAGAAGASGSAGSGGA